MPPINLQTCMIILILMVTLRDTVTICVAFSFMSWRFVISNPFCQPELTLLSCQDTLGSVGVIISTLLIQFYGWTGFDPIASLFIAILIAASVVPLVVDSGKVLCLDVAEPRDVMIQEALTEVCCIATRRKERKLTLSTQLNLIEGLASYSMPRFWPKDSSALIGSIHIQLAVSAASSDRSGPHASTRNTYTRLDRVVELVDKSLRARIPGLEELTIQVEGS